MHETWIVSCSTRAIVHPKLTPLFRVVVRPRPAPKADISEQKSISLLFTKSQSLDGLGAFLRNFLSGFVIKSFRYNVDFLELAAIAFSGLLFFAELMPETKESRIWRFSNRRARPALAERG
jgi:hypothetical protein